MTKAIDISQKVKAIVRERDGGCCILCGSPNAFPNAHYLPRSRGGLGIPENVVTLCVCCHMSYDNGGARKALESRICDYLIEKYPAWDAQKLIYRKW